MSALKARIKAKAASMKAGAIGIKSKAADRVRAVKNTQPSISVTFFLLHHHLHSFLLWIMCVDRMEVVPSQIAERYERITVGFK